MNFTGSKERLWEDIQLTTWDRNCFRKEKKHRKIMRYFPPQLVLKVRKFVTQQFRFEAVNSATGRLQHAKVLVVGHDGLLERCQDVLEVILGLGGDVLTQNTT